MAGYRVSEFTPEPRTDAALQILDLPWRAERSDLPASKGTGRKACPTQYSQASPKWGEESPIVATCLPSAVRRLFAGIASPLTVAHHGGRGVTSALLSPPRSTQNLPAQ